MKTSDITFDDVQGLIRFSHSHLSEAKYLLLKIKDAKAAREWLREAPISSAEKQDTKPDKALQAAFTVQGLRALEVSEKVISGFSDEFLGGVADAGNRSRRLGDIGQNHPENWSWGGINSGPPDILLMVFCESGQLAAYLESIQTSIFTTAFEIYASLPSDLVDDKEHFGFADGVSQPKVDWSQEISTDVHERDRYANLLALGEVVLGYSNEYGLYTDRPLVELAKDRRAKVLPTALDQPKLRDVGRNGSYLVFRQLSQDVPAFWQYADKQAGGDPTEREFLATAMVGRKMDGTPLVNPSREPIQGEELGSQNHFTYDNDPHGTKCPIGAHVRRSNPRTGDYPPGVSGLISRLIRALGFKRSHPQEDLVSSTRFHRLVRRGRPYGPKLSQEEALKGDAPAQERGLHFLCLGANISRQFEFVQNAWLARSKFAGLPTERDPLLGDREPLNNGQSTDRFTMPQEGGAARCITEIPQFVTVRGGAYFFMPGMRALQYLASEPLEIEDDESGDSAKSKRAKRPSSIELPGFGESLEKQSVEPERSKT